MQMCMQTKMTVPRPEAKKEKQNPNECPHFITTIGNSADGVPCQTCKCKCHKHVYLVGFMRL